MQDPQHGIELTSPEEAQHYADNGATVFACYLNKEGGHGHIAVIAPSESLVDAKSFGNSVMLYNIGVTNGLMPINEVFKSSEFSGFYIFLADKQAVDDKMSTKIIDLPEVVCIGSMQAESKKGIIY